MGSRSHWGPAPSSGVLPSPSLAWVAWWAPSAWASWRTDLAGENETCSMWPALGVNFSWLYWEAKPVPGCHISEDIFNVIVKNFWVLCLSVNGSVYFLCGSAEPSQAITPNGGYEACPSWARCPALMFPRVVPSFFYSSQCVRPQSCFLSVVLCSQP